ncbi:MAG: glycosyltransferase 4 family protein [Candidatus Hydrothermarchaeales archaeon]
MEIILFICFLVAFLTTYLLTPLWIRAVKKAGLIGKDLNKFDRPEVADFGGITVVAGFMAGVLTYIGLTTFYFHFDPLDTYLFLILAGITTVLSITVVGMLDDVLGWKTGLKQWQKPLLTIPAALPMMAVNAGHSTMAVPFFGTINFGILYPLVIIPLGIAGASNGFNMLAGFNGLEAGLGALILGFLGFVAWQTGNSWVTMLSVSMLSALLAFLLYNWHPAKIFPGDTLTYSVGALIATVAILGNMEKIAMILFSLYFIEFLIKAKTKFKGECFGKPMEDGTLSIPRKKVVLSHLILALGCTQYLSRPVDKIQKLSSPSITPFLPLWQTHGQVWKVREVYVL